MKLHDAALMGMIDTTVYRWDCRDYIRDTSNGNFEITVSHKGEFEDSVCKNGYAHRYFKIKAGSLICVVDKLHKSATSVKVIRINHPLDCEDKSTLSLSII
jgi:hypothetical protein